VYRVGVFGRVLGEELEPDDLFLVLVHLFGAVGEDHVVQPLVRGARDLGVFEDNVQILLKRPLPVEFPVVADVEFGPQLAENRFPVAHGQSLRHGAAAPGVVRSECLRRSGVSAPGDSRRRRGTRLGKAGGGWDDSKRMFTMRAANWVRAWGR